MRKMTKQKRREELNDFIHVSCKDTTFHIYKKIDDFIKTLPQKCSDAGTALDSGFYYQSIELGLPKIIRDGFLSQLDEIFELSHKLNIRFNETECLDVEKYVGNGVIFAIKHCRDQILETIKKTNGPEAYEFDLALNNCLEQTTDDINIKIRLYKMRTHLQDDDPEVKRSKRAFKISIISLIISAIAAAAPIIQFIYNVLHSIVHVKLIK